MRDNMETTSKCGDNIHPSLNLKFTSESASELLYDRRFTVNQFVLATSTPRLETSIFLTEHFRL
jgi:hypothetical protein